MKIAIHQPNFFPYPGFFHKLLGADKLVLLDDVQFQFDYTNRNKIIAKDGTWIRISIPTKKHHKFFPINKVEINNELSWKDNIWKNIFNSYHGSPFFNAYKQFFENLFSKEWKFLFDINYYTLKNTLVSLNLKTDLILSSTLNVEGTGTNRLIKICQMLEADEYISGIGGKKYLNENLFYQNKIKLSFQSYNPIPYPQFNSKQFIPNLSIIDLLMNMGSKSLEVLKNS